MKNSHLFQKNLTFFLSLFCSVAGANDIYIAQTAQGGNTGANAANAHSLAWANTAANWGTGANLVHAGDTLHLCGTFTNQFIIQGNGAPGNPTTVFFEPGANFTAPVWSNANNNSAIYGNGLSYITINGNGTGFIQCTDNGSPPLANQTDCVGIYLHVCANIAVKNLIISNIYKKTDPADANAFGTGIYWSGGTHDAGATNDIFVQCNSGIEVDYRAGNSNVFIISNSFSNQAIGLSIGDGVNGASLSNLVISSNVFAPTSVWGGISAIHTDSIHLFHVQASGGVTNAFIDHNSFGGDLGTYSTAQLFLEGDVYGALAYDNFFHAATLPADGYCYFKISTNLVFANNTLVASESGVAIGAAHDGPATNICATNNLFIGMSSALQNNSAGLLWGTNDYNVYAGGSMNFQNDSVDGSISFPAWQAIGQDPHSTTTAPRFVPGTYVPVAHDVVAGGAGTNLTFLGITNDFNGNPRPATGPWDIGAFVRAVPSGNTTIVAPGNFHPASPGSQ